MSDIIFGINLITTPANIKKKILKELVKNLKIKLPAMRPKIETTVRGLIGKYIKLSPEYLSFAGGLLQQELGVVDPYQSLNDMVVILANSAKVIMKPVSQTSSKISGGFTVTAVPEDFYSQIEGLGRYTSEKGYVIPWLQWLLTAGDEVIIQDYRISFGGQAKQFSRTGGPIMRRSGDGWGVSAASSRIPSQYSGTSNNNFVTRAMDMMQPELQKKIEAIVRSKL